MSSTTDVKNSSNDHALVPEPFAAQVELGLRTNAVLREWLEEQVRRTGGRRGAI